MQPTPLHELWLKRFACVQPCTGMHPCGKPDSGFAPSGVVVLCGAPCVWLVLRQLATVQHMHPHAWLLCRNTCIVEASWGQQAKNRSVFLLFHSCGPCLGLCAQPAMHVRGSMYMFWTQELHCGLRCPCVHLCCMMSAVGCSRWAAKS